MPTTFVQAQGVPEPSPCVAQAEQFKIRAAIVAQSREQLEARLAEMIRLYDQAEAEKRQLQEQLHKDDGRNK